MRHLPQAEQRSIRVAIADDHQPMRLLLRTVLELVPNVEIAGEAVNGVEAVRLAERERPDVFFVDVNMPQLDGPGAAELIHAFRPGTRTILHTAAPYGPPQARARDLGMRVYDKAHLLQSVHELVGEAGPARGEDTLREVETVVVTAMQAAHDQAVVVARPDGTVPFYNAFAARELGLPYPPHEASLASLRSHYEACYPDGRPLPPRERPINRALTERRPVDLALALRVGDRARPYRAHATPFFDEDGELLGAAQYFSRAAA